MTNFTKEQQDKFNGFINEYKHLCLEDWETHLNVIYKIADEENFPAEEINALYYLIEGVTDIGFEVSFENEDGSEHHIVGTRCSIEQYKAAYEVARDMNWSELNAAYDRINADWWEAVKLHNMQFKDGDVVDDDSETSEIFQKMIIARVGLEGVMFPDTRPCYIDYLCQPA